MPACPIERILSSLMDPNSNTSSPKDSRAHLDRRQMFHFLHQTICSDRTDCHMVGWTNGFSDLVNEMILSCYRHRLCSTKCNIDVWYWKGSILEIELFSARSVHPVTSEACRSKYLTWRSFQPFFVASSILDWNVLDSKQKYVWQRNLSRFIFISYTRDGIFGSDLP